MLSYLPPARQPGRLAAVRLCARACPGGAPGAEPDAGTCLTCISVPKSDLVLDA